METGRNEAASPDNLRVAYFPRKDATPEGELAALAAVYAFLIRVYERNKATAPATEREGAPRSMNAKERRDRERPNQARPNTLRASR